ncbi:MAG: sensor histidine kinase [Treponema sp.]|nr:sensor histidine kinase [Treponema sp.]
MKEKYIPGFRSILLSFSLSMLGVIVFICFILFARLYIVIGDMEERMQQYIYLNQLSEDLEKSKASFIQYFSSFEAGDEQKMQSAKTLVAMHRYQALRIAHLLQSDYDASPQKYFLNRGIVNGLNYITGVLLNWDETTPELTTATYNLYYRVLRVFDYLSLYTNSRYLSAAVASDADASIQNMKTIRTLRIVSLILFVVIVCCSVVGALAITKRLTNHVSMMLSSADAITRGDFMKRDLELTGPREFVHLKDKINHMKHSLNERITLEHKLHTQALEHEKITKQLETARYLSLQAQIHPHFLFNTLNVISHTALFEHAEKTVRLINSLAAIFRYRLEFKDSVSITDELSFTQQYLEIQKARFGDRLSYDIQCDEELDSIMIPPFVIQPFVENAVKHGIEPKEDGGLITVCANKVSDSVIELLIEDDGVGVPEDFTVSFIEASGRQHIGITNVISRLTMYFGKDLSVYIKRKSVEGGTIVVITIPYKK